MGRQLMQNHDAGVERKSDEDLVGLAQAGDNKAFEELMRRHQPSCAKLAFSILRDSAGAEDEVQNASWKAFQHIKQFQRDSKFSTWFSRIAANQCLMRLRREKRAKFVSVDDACPAGGHAPLVLRDGAIGPEAALGRREVASVLNREIGLIPPMLRNVFVLRHVQELPMSDVACRLGISVAAAKSRLLRARLELRQRLEKHFGRQGAATLTA